MTLVKCNRMYCTHSITLVLLTFLAITVSDAYRYDLIFSNDDVKQDMEPSVAVQLINQRRDADTGHTHLTFNIVYAPFKVME